MPRPVNSILLKLLIFGLPVWTFASTLPEAATDRLTAAVENHYNRAKTLSVHFSETFSIQGHSRPPEWGTLTLRKAGKMRWDYSTPAGKLFISDGKNVFLYTARDNRVEKIPLKNTEDMRAPLAFLLGHLDLKKEFQDWQMESSRDTDSSWLKGYARRGDLPYRSVRMLVRANGEIKQLGVIGEDTSTLTFSLNNEVVNPSAPESLFQFTPPPGATIVDAVGYGTQDLNDR